MSYVTGISGNVISAASAGYAPTNSADVSAIASAYQVVSSTSTQLYAGTAFLTGVNGDPLSASRAGNAANAGMANSAYYDGTGRLISSLPDSAAVSSIASSYAESAASGKLDSSASSSFYTVDNPSGFITGVDLSEYATTGYVDSAVSGKQDTLTFAWDADSAISSINGSALAGGGGATGDYVEKSAMEVAIGSGNNVSATALAQGADNVASGASVAFGVNNKATQSAISVGGYCSANYNALAVGQHCRAWENSLAVGNTADANNQGLAVGDRCTASVRALAVGYQASAYRDSVAAGEFCSAKNTAVAFGKYNLHVDGDTSTGDSAAFVIGDGEYGARHDLMLVTKDGEITMYSSTADTTGTGIMSSIRAISAAATGGGVDSATVSAIASAYVESAASSKLDTTAFNSGDFYSTSNPSGFITGVDLTNYATTAYVDSSVSGKLDTTAFNSGDFYTTANESGYVGSAYVDSAVSGKMDSSAMTSYALSADVSGTVDLVSTQSANWGGSALALSAGTGMTLEKVGNTLVASTDETVLFSGTATNTNVVLNEALDNFERIKIYAYWKGTNTYDYYGYSVTEIYTSELSSGKRFTVNVFCNLNSDELYSIANFSVASTKTQLNLVNAKRATFTEQLISTNDGPTVYKVVGINRTAEA